jgi:hypothetical protein
MKLDLNINYIGLKYNRLTILSHFINKKHHRMADVVCDCGNNKVVRLRDVVFGAILSCGCYNKEPNPKRNKYKIRLIEHNGETKHISEWCRTLSLNKKNLEKFLRKEERTIQDYINFLKMKK